LTEPNYDLLIANAIQLRNGLQQAFRENDTNENLAATLGAIESIVNNLETAKHEDRRSWAVNLACRARSGVINKDEAHIIFQAVCDFYDISGD